MAWPYNGRRGGAQWLESSLYAKSYGFHSAAYDARLANVLTKSPGVTISVDP